MIDLDAIERQAQAATHDFSVPVLRRNVLALVARIRELETENAKLQEMNSVRAELLEVFFEGQSR